MLTMTTDKESSGTFSLSGSIRRQACSIRISSCCMLAIRSFNYRLYANFLFSFLEKLRHEQQRTLIELHDFCLVNEEC